MKLTHVLTVLAAMALVACNRAPLPGPAASPGAGTATTTAGEADGAGRGAGDAGLVVAEAEREGVGGAIGSPQCPQKRSSMATAVPQPLQRSQREFPHWLQNRLCPWFSF